MIGLGLTLMRVKSAGEEYGSTSFVPKVSGATAIFLLLTRRFAPLFHCQFLAAFGENFVLNAVVLLILFKSGGPDHVALIPLATAVLIGPSFLLSALGGELADRFDMTRIARRLRAAAIGVAVLAAFGFVLQWLALLFVALLLFGVVAALFAPIKYGSLPHLLAPAELPAGNALVESSTIIGVLLATVAAGLTVRFGGPVWLAALTVLVMAASWSAGLFMPPIGESAPDLKVRRNILASTFHVLLHLRDDRRIAWGALTTSWFWAVGVVVVALLPPLVKQSLGGNEIAVTACLAIFSLGVAAGSALAAWLVGGRITVRPTAVAAVLVAVFSGALGWASWGLAPPAEGRATAEIFGSMQGLSVTTALAGLAISGGLFIVPVMAAVQAWVGPDRRARVMAGVNVLTAAAMTCAALITAMAQAFGASPQLLFILLGVGGLAIAAIICSTMPEKLNWRVHLRRMAGRHDT